MERKSRLLNLMHPSSKISSLNSNRLEGKRIVLGITGSVAAFLAPKIARELIREGAIVIPVMSKDGLKMIGKDLMWWATGIEPITVITGNLEHISMAGVMNKPVDMMLIAPCTTNTVAKIASGIADTPVTLIASSLIGKGIPVQFLVVAHQDLYNSGAIVNAIKILKSRKCSFIQPFIEEGKAKIPPMEEVVFRVLMILTPKYLHKQHAIITGGPTKEAIDDVRYISNDASGKSAIYLAKEALLHGAEVTLILGEVLNPIPNYLKPIIVKSAKDMFNETIKQVNLTKKPIVILTAAVSDFVPEKRISGKVKSNTELNISFKKNKKISNEIKKANPDSILIIYKAEWDVTTEELIQRTNKKIEESNADLGIANDLSLEEGGFATNHNRVIIVRKDGKTRKIKGLKSSIAYEIINHVYRKFILEK